MKNSYKIVPKLLFFGCYFMSIYIIYISLSHSLLGFFFSFSFFPSLSANKKVSFGLKISARRRHFLLLYREGESGGEGFRGETHQFCVTYCNCNLYIQTVQEYFLFFIFFLFQFNKKKDIKKKPVDFLHNGWEKKFQFG